MKNDIYLRRTLQKLGEIQAGTRSFPSFFGCLLDDWAEITSLLRERIRAQILRDLEENARYFIPLSDYETWRRGRDKTIGGGREGNET